MLKYVIFGPVSDCTKNLGDQALILWCIELLSHKKWKIVLLLSRNSNINFLSHVENLEIIYLPKITLFFKHPFDGIYFFCFLLNSYFFHIKALYFLWADIIDGRWWPFNSIFSFLFLINTYIADTFHIISFSFSSCKSVKNLWLLKKIKNTAFFYPRDTQSACLFQEQIAPKNNTTISDLSFLVWKHSIENVQISSWLQSMSNSKNKILLISLAKRPSINDMGKFINELVSELNTWENWCFMIICHCFDQETIMHCRSWSELLTNPSIVVEIQDVRIIRNLTYKVDAVFSCLMHCALGWIAAQKPTVILDYHKKAHHIFHDLKIPDSVLQEESNLIEKLRYLRSNYPINNSLRSAYTIAITSLEGAYNYE